MIKNLTAIGSIYNLGVPVVWPAEEELKLYTDSAFNLRMEEPLVSEEQSKLNLVTPKHALIPRQLMDLRNNCQQCLK